MKWFQENLCGRGLVPLQREYGHSLQEGSSSGAIPNIIKSHLTTIGITISSNNTSGFDGHSSGPSGCLLSYEVGGQITENQKDRNAFYARHSYIWQNVVKGWIASPKFWYDLVSFVTSWSNNPGFFSSFTVITEVTSPTTGNGFITRSVKVRMCTSKISNYMVITPLEKRELKE